MSFVNQSINLTQFIPLSASYRYDEKIDLKPRRYEYDDGYTFIRQPIFNGTKDVKFANDSFFSITSAATLQSLINDSRYINPMELVFFTSFKAANGYYITNIDNSLYATATSVGENEFFRVARNQDGTCSISQGELYATIQTENNDFSITMMPYISSDSYNLQKFTFYTAGNDDIYSIKTNFIHPDWSPYVTKQIERFLSFYDGNTQRLYDTFNYTWTQQISSGFYYWHKVATSENGLRIVAITSNAHVAISTDGGESWTIQTTLGTDNWRGVAMSADGFSIVVAASNAIVYRTNDGGQTWQNGDALTSYHNWIDLAMIPTGIIVVGATTGSSYLFKSTDSGDTWTTLTASGKRNWKAITISSDGQMIAACVDNGYIYTSSDGGTSWTTRTAAGSRLWTDISSSSDGQTIAACTNNGFLYVSLDGGVSWTATFTSSRPWTSICVSNDGSTMVAAHGYYGVALQTGIYISHDNGTSWGLDITAPRQSWGGIAISSTGERIIATGNYIFTNYDIIHHIDYSISNKSYQIKAIGMIKDSNYPTENNYKFYTTLNLNAFAIGFDGKVIWVKYYNELLNSFFNRTTDIADIINDIQNNYLIESSYKTQINNITPYTGDMKVNLISLKNIKTPEYQYQVKKE